LFFLFSRDLRDRSVGVNGRSPSNGRPTMVLVKDILQASQR
jgi:hypothetical protein